jgi:hypothetical protein
VVVGDRARRTSHWAGGQLCETQQLVAGAVHAVGLGDAGRAFHLRAGQAVAVGVVGEGGAVRSVAEVGDASNAVVRDREAAYLSGRFSRRNRRPPSLS